MYITRYHKTNCIINPVKDKKISLFPTQSKESIQGRGEKSGTGKIEEKVHEFSFF